MVVTFAMLAESFGTNLVFVGLFWLEDEDCVLSHCYRGCCCNIPGWNYLQKDCSGSLGMGTPRPRRLVAVFVLFRRREASRLGLGMAS